MPKPKLTPEIKLQTDAIVARFNVEHLEFVDKIVGGAIPKQYIPSVEKGIVEAMQEGILAGFPTVDFRVTLYDGSFHDVDSSDMAFKIAGSMGFKKGVLQANPTLLEPIMKMTVTVPEDNMGDIIGDLNGRRGRVLGVEAAGQAAGDHRPRAHGRGPPLRAGPHLQDRGPGHL